MHRTASLRFLAVLAASLALVSSAAAKATENFSQTYPFEANGAVSLSNINGDVEIVAWDKNEISVVAEKIASDEAGLKRMQIVIEHSPAHLVIKTEYEKKWKFWGNYRAEVRYKLMVPAGVTLEKIDVVNSDVTVRGVRGFVNLDSVNGTIEAEGLTAGGRFDTVNGSIRAAFDKISASDKIVLDTVNGSCSLTLPANAAFDLNADSVNGSISCDYPIKIGRSGRRHLTGSVNGGGANIVLDSVNGGLRIRAAK
ncbi:MAG: hypothetical protein C0518_07385 [Opitutus sp.]|nr:hypothetical protein [Opitutus sp.]